MQRRSSIPDNIRGLYDNHSKRNTRPSLRELSTLLEAEVRSLSKAFIVVDALDECTDINQTRHRLVYELQKLLPTARLLFTSRPHITDIDQFRDFVRLEVLASDEDIEAYIRERIATHSRLKLFVQNDDVFKNHIVGTIMGKAQGM